MSIPTVHASLLGPHPVPIIDPRIHSIFAVITDHHQRSLVSQLELFIKKVKADGSIIHLLRLGVLTPENMNEKYVKKHQVLEMSYWQVVQFYRVSRDL
jgi:hypothetical protein